MERREFLAGLTGGIVMAGSAAEGAQQAGAGSSAQTAPEFYAWQQFRMRSGTQQQRVGEFLQKAAIPALNRLGHQPVGVFTALAGAATPTLFVLVPLRGLEMLAAIEGQLARDSEFLQAGAAYLDAPATDPAYERRELSVLAAFSRFPRLQVPPQTAEKRPRLFELRTYESHSEKAHRAKVQMFEEMGEIAIFRRVGLQPVFFSHTLIGPRMPSLVYLLVHDNLAAREKNWAAFGGDPEWKKLAATPGYSNADIVSNITTVFLQPTAYSQI